MNKTTESYLLNTDKTIDVMHLMNYISNIRDRMGTPITIVMSQETLNDYFLKPK